MMIPFGDSPPRLHFPFSTRHSVNSTPYGTLRAPVCQLLLRFRAETEKDGQTGPLRAVKMGFGQSLGAKFCAQSNIWGVAIIYQLQWDGGDPILVYPPPRVGTTPFRQPQANDDLYYRDPVIRETSTKNTSYERSRFHLKPLLNRSKKTCNS